MSHQRHMGGGGEGDEGGKKRPPILSDKAFKEFDELLRNPDSNDGGWAGPQGEIDYRWDFGYVMDLLLKRLYHIGCSTI